MSLSEGRGALDLVLLLLLVFVQCTRRCTHTHTSTPHALSLPALSLLKFVGLKEVVLPQ